jgi:hypothetical protein
VDRVSRQLKIDGDITNLNGTILTDAEKTTAIVKINGTTVQIIFKPNDSNDSIYLTGTITQNPITFKGTGKLSDDQFIEWHAELISPISNEKIIRQIKNSTEEKQVIYPFCSYGKKLEDRSLFEEAINDFKTRYNAILIKNVTIWTNEAEGILKNQCVYMTEGRIVRIADDIKAPKLAFAKVIDGTGKHLTAGIIDEQSQIAVSTVLNEGNQLSSAGARISDVINSDDENIYSQLKAGVTTAHIIQCSNNAIGAQSCIIKLRWGKSPEEIKYAKSPEFIKFTPSSATKYMYADYFKQAKQYAAQQKTYNELSTKNKLTTIPPRTNLELTAIADILNQKRFIICFPNDPAKNMLIKFTDSMGIKLSTFTKIPDTFKGTKNLPSIQDKLSDENKWKLMTLIPAKLLHIDKRVGSIKVGKDADVVLWTDNPFSKNAKVDNTIIDGLIYYDNEEEAILKIAIEKEKVRIIKKMLNEKEKGAKTQKIAIKSKASDGCGNADLNY